VHIHGRGAQHNLGVQGSLPGRNATKLGLTGSVKAEEGSREQESRKIMLDKYPMTNRGRPGLCCKRLHCEFINVYSGLQVSSL